MNNEVPGCYVPESIMNRLCLVKDSKEASREEGILISREILKEIFPNINGVQLSVPFGRVQTIMDVLEEIN